MPAKVVTRIQSFAPFCIFPLSHKMPLDPITMGRQFCDTPREYMITVCTSLCKRDYALHFYNLRNTVYKNRERYFTVSEKCMINTEKSFENIWLCMGSTSLCKCDYALHRIFSRHPRSTNNIKILRKTYFKDTVWIILVHDNVQQMFYCVRALHCIFFCPRSIVSKDWSLDNKYKSQSEVAFTLTGWTLIKFHFSVTKRDHLVLNI